MNTFSIYQVDKDAPTYGLQEEISIEPGDDPYSQRIIYSIHEFMIYFLAYKYHAESWGKQIRFHC